ncbi:MAG: cell division protein FtsA [Alphaproteobacteria bacterium]|nr:cell division protein FtsA [Alphaproteobacteria bacterium]MDP7182944.1 cell division protein FtsA [Alphaproteobacteria bacterium]MDP7190614.1 cell division protein FtsA [Alphaproteobacteria bacterium]HJO88393.1 cell division protein FtsA [Alphaproteobacteria bacterium]
MRNDLITVLDVGTTKICCFVARKNADSRSGARVVGIGHHAANGLRGGVIVDMDVAAESIASAVHTAEKMAEETIRSVIVNISGGQPLSQNFSVETDIAGHEISDGDLRRIFQHGMKNHQLKDREIIHSIPTTYSIDGSRSIRDPRGMFGEHLGVNIHLVSVTHVALRNLSNCLSRCHLEIQDVVLSAYASGLSSLVEDEMDLGVTCIDMGGGTTSLSVFFDGNIVFTGSVPLGGHHVTSDIARGLSTTMANAERIKALYGNAIPSDMDDRDCIDVPPIGEEVHALPNHVPKSLLIGIIRPRLEEILEMARDLLERSGFDKVAGQWVVLTGGASQMQGIQDLTAMIFDKKVRTGKPIHINGLAEATRGPAFSTCAGLLIYAKRNTAAMPVSAHGWMERPDGFFNRLSLWLRECF